MLGLSLSSYLVVDKNMGPIESLKVSWAVTQGARWQLCCFGGLIVLLNLAGLLCLGLGLIITVPVSWIAGAYVYDRLAGQTLLEQA